MKNLEHDTDSAKVTRFNQHGRLVSRVEGNVLLNEATGPFNAEIIAAIQLIQQDLLTEIGTKQDWAQIYVFHDSVLCSPDTIEALHDYLTQLRGTLRRPAATAFVIGPTVEGRAIMVPHYRQVYAKAQFNFQIFDTEDSAKSWVAQALSMAAD